MFEYVVLLYGCGRLLFLESGFWRIFRIGTMRCIVFTLTFDSSPIKGEGELVVGLACCLPSHCPSGLRIKSAMMCVAHQCKFPALWIPAYAGMTVDFAKVSHQGRGVYGWCCLVHPCHPAALWILP